jgi:hypothetical protein
MCTGPFITKQQGNKIAWEPKDILDRPGVLGWGTLLQAGRSRIRFPTKSLDFSIDLILPAALWPWSWLSLKQNWVPGIILGATGGRHVRLQHHNHLWADCLENVGVSTSHNYMGIHGLLQGCFYLFVFTLTWRILKEPFRKTWIREYFSFVLLSAAVKLFLEE